MSLHSLLILRPLPKLSIRTNVDPIASSAPPMYVPNIEPYSNLISKPPTAPPEPPTSMILVLTVISPTVSSAVATNIAFHVQDH